MTRNRRIVVVSAVAVTALAAGGAAIARTVGGSDEGVYGPAAAQAKAAAVHVTGGGQALEVERQDGDGAGVYEVEVRRQDGSHVDVLLDAQFKPVGSVADDDKGDSGEQDDTGEDAQN